MELLALVIAVMAGIALNIVSVRFATQVARRRWEGDVYSGVDQSNTVLRALGSRYRVRVGRRDGVYTVYVQEVADWGSPSTRAH